VVEGWLIGEVWFFELSLGNHRSEEYFCPSTLRCYLKQFGIKCVYKKHYF